MNGYSKEELRADLQRCYKTYLKHSDMVHLLKNGENKLTDHDIDEILLMLPTDREHGLLVDDLVEFIYK